MYLYYDSFLFSLFLGGFCFGSWLIILLEFCCHGKILMTEGAVLIPAFLLKVTHFLDLRLLLPWLLLSLLLLPRLLLSLLLHPHPMVVIVARTPGQEPAIITPQALDLYLLLLLLLLRGKDVSEPAPHSITSALLEEVACLFDKLEAIKVLSFMLGGSVLSDIF